MGLAQAWWYFQVRFKELRASFKQRNGSRGCTSGSEGEEGRRYKVASVHIYTE